ncbi:DUF3135 domain-containing protein [Uliginosibacterium sp. sgz301328]|uniref:DUF3135 domain-containing protein n=1 Tax=Uliginosibacterium sp. sgz301328 TaxID=3243764 RepID=UPI00359EE2E6
MKRDSAAEFDFDHWADLAASDPPGFFAERRRAIEAFIASAPPQQAAALRDLQAIIDQTRLEAGTPARAVSQLMDMLSDQLEIMRLNLIRLRQESLEMAERWEGRD